MNVTRRTRALLAAPRRGLASLLTGLFLALAIIGAGVLCSVPLDAHLHGGTQVRDDGGQLAVQLAAAPDPAGAEAPEPTAPEPLGDGPRDCSDRHAPSIQCAPLPPVTSPGPAAMPEPAFPQPALIPVHDDAPAPVNTAEATGPSLHALGISRT